MHGSVQLNGLKMKFCCFDFYPILQSNHSKRWLKSWENVTASDCPLFSMTLINKTIPSISFTLTKRLKCPVNWMSLFLQVRY